MILTETFLNRFVHFFAKIHDSDIELWNPTGALDSFVSKFRILGILFLRS